MFVRVMYLSALTLYTVLTAVLLKYFDAHILMTVFFLSLIPLLVMWYLEHLHTRLLPLVLLITIGLTTLIEVYAYVNGIWYETTVSEIRLFRLFPVEAFIASFTHIVYFVVAYEYFFDDRKTSAPKAKETVYTTAGVMLILALGVSYIYLFSGLILSHAYLILIMGAFFVFLIGVAFAHRSPTKILKKALLYALTIFPVSLSYEYVSLQNELRFFANTNEYFYTFTVFNQILPAEELIFVLLVPFWIAVIYELYLDDGK